MAEQTHHLPRNVSPNPDIINYTWKKSGETFPTSLSNPVWLCTVVERLIAGMVHCGGDMYGKRTELAE
jgi:hypothetical protein